MGSSSPSLQPPINGESHHRGFRHAAHAREAIRQFLHPDGRRIHVASSPEHAVKLKRRLEQVAAPPDDRFDVYISGSSEHLDAVRQAQTFHEARREALREAHGDVYQQVSNVHSELDVLADEIRRVTTHGVSLDAHFNRFGYSAHIKSYDDWDDSSPSGSATPRPPSLHSEKTGSTQPAIEHSLKFFKMPVVRQYFHKDILWRASGNEEVQSFELFVDLLYVGIIAINGDAAAENPTGTSLLRFVITFTLSWKIWNDTALIISWFETDDIFQRLSIIFLLSCLFGYTTNITQAFETTYPTLIGFYLAARFFMGTYLLGIGYVIPMIRGPMALFGLSVLAGAALWIASIHVAWPNQLILIWLALFIELCAPVLQMGLMQITKRIRSGTTTLYERYFAFQPAINIEHRTERTNAFVTMVFGYTVVAILYQSTVNGIDAFFGKGILGLIQAFCFNWIYFEIDGANLKTHAIRRHRVSALTWSSLHLPFIMSFVLAGGALSRLVVAHDTPDAFTSQLTDEYGARSEEEIASGIRWFYCTGLGLALACMGGISWTHVHREIEGLRLRKMWRLVVRFGVAITLVCLSLADHLDSTELVATATCLTVLVLSTELWFGSSCLEALCSRSQPCRYVGQCGRQKMEELVRGQSDLSLSNLAEKPRRADGAALTPI